MKAKVHFMNGGRVDGYYYVQFGDTCLIACEDGHPDFVMKFDEMGDKGKKDAQKLARKINKQIKDSDNLLKKKSVLKSNISKKAANRFKKMEEIV